MGKEEKRRGRRRNNFTFSPSLLSFFFPDLERGKLDCLAAAAAETEEGKRRKDLGWNKWVGDDDLVELLIHRPGVQARLYFIKVKCWKEAICLALLIHDSFPWAKPAFQQSSRVFFYPNLFKTPSSPFSHLFYLVSLCMISRARNVAVVPRVSF
jgi:hypothetical protein